MSKISYPIKFEPILIEKIWGGEKLMNLLNKKSSKKRIGESWEISGLETGLSIVSNKELAGSSLKEIISQYQSELLGSKVYNQFGTNFPLLVKYIDAKQPLSIQLHPDDELAKKRHNSFGKTEMWHVMDSEPKSELIVGLKSDISKKEYLKSVNENRVVDVLNTFSVSEGDTYFIPAGCIHAIGGGILLAEIQQTSDITYRIYDWDRPDVDGEMRELHNEEALEAIDFAPKTSYKSNCNKELNKQVSAVECPYFSTNIIAIKGEISIDHTDKDSFVIYMCTKGAVEFVYGDGKEVISLGETVLIPACLKRFDIVSNQYSELLEVYID